MLLVTRIGQAQLKAIKSSNELTALELTQVRQSYRRLKAKASTAGEANACQTKTVTWKRPDFFDLTIKLTGRIGMLELQRAKIMSMDRANPVLTRPRRTRRRTRPTKDSHVVITLESEHVSNAPGLQNVSKALMTKELSRMERELQAWETITNGSECRTVPERLTAERLLEMSDREFCKALGGEKRVYPLLHKL